MRATDSGGWQGARLTGMTGIRLVIALASSLRQKPSGRRIECGVMSKTTQPFAPGSAVQSNP